MSLGLSVMTWCIIDCCHRFTDRCSSSFHHKCMIISNNICGIYSIIKKISATYTINIDTLPNILEKLSYEEFRTWSSSL